MMIMKEATDIVLQSAKSWTSLLSTIVYIDYTFDDELMTQYGPIALK